jgi:hypothetical protein
LRRWFVTKQEQVLSERGIPCPQDEWTALQGPALDSELVDIDTSKVTVSGIERVEEGFARVSSTTSGGEDVSFYIATPPDKR